MVGHLYQINQITVTIQTFLLRKKPIKVYGTKTLMEIYLLMITNMQIDRLNKILAHGPWKSPAELIFDALAENLKSIPSSPPLGNFDSLSNHEYDIVMSYGLTRIANLKCTDTIHTGTVTDIEYFGELDYPKEPSDNVEIKDSKSSIKFTNRTIPIKKLPSVKKSYKSIWDNPSLDIENSLIGDEAIALFPPLSQNGCLVNKSLSDFNITIEHDNSIDKSDTNLKTQKKHKKKMTIEQSNKIIKKFLADYQTELIVETASDD